jgi:hypothetical protein
MAWFRVQLTEDEQRIVIEERASHPNPRVRDKMWVLWLLHCGLTREKAAEIVGSAKSIAQFLDRDTRPDFASTVMIPSLQSYIKNPKDVAGLLKSIEDQKKSIFTS